MMNAIVEASSLKSLYKPVTMKQLLILFLLFISSGLCAKTEPDTIYASFLKILAEKEYYTLLKQARIAEAKNLLAVPDINDRQKYDINYRLYNEYKTFIADSAIHYVKDNITLASRMNDENRLAESRMALASLYSIAGLYVDAIKEMDKVSKDKLPPWLLSTYYSTNNQLYNFYASLSDIHNKEYREISSAYRDSLLAILDTDTHYYKIVYAEKLYDNDRLDEAKELLQGMLNDSQQENHERAVLAYALSNIYKKEGNTSQRKRHLAISATNDIKNAIKENASLQALASVLYDEGNISMAYKCIKSSLEDAMFCNARLRTFEVARIFPIIDTAYQESIMKQKKELTIFLIAISILSLFLMCTVVYIYKQIRRVARIRKELYHANVKLQELNTTLQTTNISLSSVNEKLSLVNSELSDANQLKETYISHFLDLCSTYITKLERYRVMLNKKAAERKVDELFKILKSNEMVDKELRELYKNFDNTFLHLYPNFIRDFNRLLIEGEQFDINATGLNTELRIFALIRLGITDSSRIADFLHYSATTIYNYRTRMRNKAVVPREDFEYLVRRIGLITK